MNRFYSISKLNANCFLLCVFFFLFVFLWLISCTISKMPWICCNPGFVGHLLVKFCRSSVNILSDISFHWVWKTQKHLLSLSNWIKSMQSNFFIRLLVKSSLKKEALKFRACQDTLPILFQRRPFIWLFNSIIPLSQLSTVFGNNELPFFFFLEVCIGPKKVGVLWKKEEAKVERGVPSW